MIILGIDPGTTRIGCGVIKKTQGKIEFVYADLLGIEGKGHEALRDTKRKLDALIEKYKPEVLAVEKLFFVRNQKTGMAVAEARGVIVLSALEKGLRIREYSPNEVKEGVTGYGHADKKAVNKMVKLILAVPNLKVIDDASDALAIAIMAANEREVPQLEP